MFNLKINIIYRVLTFILISLFFVKNAYAYLDGGTGSYVIQVFIGVLMGAIITIKFYWRSIKEFIKKHLKYRK